jgi:hypothetical protein
MAQTIADADRRSQTLARLELSLDLVPGTPRSGLAQGDDRKTRSDLMFDSGDSLVAAWPFTRRT